MRVFAGCDGGGTKCDVHLAVCDEQLQVLRTASATLGPANVKSNPELALENIRSATFEALQAAAVPRNVEIEAFVLALAGAGCDALQEEWESTLSTSLSVRSVSVVPDAAVLFAAADLADDEPAIALVVGTGSIAWARDESGKLQRAGGLGPLNGDEGSGFWIGSQAIGRLAEFGSVAPSNAGTHEIANFSLSVFRTAPSNEDAQAIIREAAQHATKLLLSAGNCLDTTEAEPAHWLCAGGVAVNQSEWLQVIQDNCAEDNLYLKTPTLIRKPAIGALNLALRSAKRSTNGCGSAEC